MNEPNQPPVIINLPPAADKQGQAEITRLQGMVQQLQGMVQQLQGIVQQSKQDFEAFKEKVDSAHITGPGHSGTIGNGLVFNPSTMNVQGIGVCVGSQIQFTFSFG